MPRGCRNCRPSHRQGSSDSGLSETEISKPSAPALRSMIDTVSAIYDSLLSIGDDKKISNDNVILATALVKVKCSSGDYVLARALLDSGSQTNLITEELAQKLRIKRKIGRLNLTGIGEVNSIAKPNVEISVMSRVNSTQFISKFWVLSSITNIQPDRRICTTNWNIPKNISLADPEFYKPQKVDFLIGSEMFFELLCVGQIKSNPSLPVLQKTSLGWIVAGKYNQPKGSCSKVCNISNIIENEEAIDSIVKKFWELEEVSHEKQLVYNEEQQKCKENFKNSVRRLPSGRFQVSLTFKSDTNLLGSSYDTAKRRFLTLERKLSNDQNMREINFQMILWRQSASDSLQVFRLNTITYGTSSAPFLAIRCLIYLSDLYKETLPIGANVIRSDFYIDDLLTGADSFDKLITIRDQVTQILSSAGFNLTKWFSNHPDFNISDRTEKLLQNDSDSAKALGIHWENFLRRMIHLSYLENDFKNLKATKRNILSELWIQKLNWDKSIPLRLNTTWDIMYFKVNLLKIDSIEIPRFVHTTSSASVQIHGFSDASIRAYGCCIYIRSSISDNVSCRLLTAKSKIAPLKTKSLPRLELCAAHLLWIRVKRMISFEIESVYFWTDSEITLHWIKTHPSTLATFVSNRVAEIQEWSENVSWRHVPTRHNPADLVSRGCDVDDLKQSIWFDGPSFLLKDNSMWPFNNHFELTEDQVSLNKRKTNVLAAVEKSMNLENVFLKLIEDHSLYKKF
ncbi:hypothetical protein CVS40_11578 [Lucilia cuprina]|nr:hypothetical protein CVS40_11578 [Lucilia cuprina]